MKGSSFQEKNELLEFEDTYSNVMALYTVLKSEGRPPAIRRAELKQGEVTAEAIDFICDVEAKAKRLLSPTQYRLFMKFAAEEKYNSVPSTLRQSLGLLFLRSNLNYDGDYRVLYYRAKNNQLHDREEPMHFPEEEITNES
jgi:hypothetical protein